MKDTTVNKHHDETGPSEEKVNRESESQEKKKKSAKKSGSAEDGNKASAGEITESSGEEVFSESAGQPGEDASLESADQPGSDTGGKKLLKTAKKDQRVSGNESIPVSWISSEKTEEQTPESLEKADRDDEDIDYPGDAFAGEDEDQDIPEEPLIKHKQKQTESANYSLLSRVDLAKLLEHFIFTRPVSEIRHDVEAIKISFYKKLKAEMEQRRRNFIAEGGNPEDFKPADDTDELWFRELLKKYRELKIENSRSIEDEKQENLERKYEIIEEIKELVNSQESINKTFNDFRELQDRWRSTGPVPQQSLNNLWETYHHHVEIFYDYIKINKELRDLDLKKNLEEKIILAEKAEALLIEPNIINAFNILQQYHEEWREIGPVPKEKRAEIWERFREATAKINRNYQQYYQDLKEQQKKNYEQKMKMCIKAEDLSNDELRSHQEWIKKTNEIIALQKIWKTIGFAPRKENNRVYERFRAACDKFFEKKKEFYARSMEEQNRNYQNKLELCLQAEALQNNTDWKKTTDDYIQLQRKWKEIGPVPRKYSEQIWKRFRRACDNFFTGKSEYFKNIGSVYDNNLALKEALIDEVVNFKSSGDIKKDLEILQGFQRRWTEIGFVPLNKKEAILQKFREVINKHFDALDVDDLQKNVLKFESRLKNIKQKPRSDQKLKFEREKFMNKLIQLKNDISVYENNIGFFSDSGNSEEMKRDFEKKIADTHKKIKLLEEKIHLIDKLDTDD